MWQPMLPTLAGHVDEQEKWLYEVKYDGFRCGLEWKKSGITLWSRNNHDLTEQFPEIVTWCNNHQEYVANLLPLFLDGELVILRTPYQSIFSQVQQRSRLKTKKKIEMSSTARPASYISFDIVEYKGKSVINKTLSERKKLLETVFRSFSLETNLLQERLAMVTSFESLQEMEALVFLHQCEGIVVKDRNSHYAYGKRTENWLKVKNYRKILGVVAGWNSKNDYFQTVIYNNKQWSELGKVKNGMNPEERKTVTTFIRENGTKQNAYYWKVNPSICIEINCLDAENQELREPNFSRFRFDLEPEECTPKQLALQLSQLPETIEVNKPEKLLFPNVSKQDLVTYYRQVAPFMLPRLSDKHLTVIRYPDGIDEDSFFQKHLSKAEPAFIETEGDHLLCNNLDSLLYFANHAAIEFHIPFHKIKTKNPDEIVFDLDPPSLDQFPLAVLAAKLIRQLLDYKGFESFVKTSGKTGLQVHTPVKGSMSFDQTRELMEAIAHVLVDKYPESFTTERLIKNRGNKLYIDYVQHAPKKTIIAPYSTRATKEATVSTPLFWEELTEDLDPRVFTVKTIPERLNQKGCPFLIGGCTIID
ncbi:DNA ligase D [Gracilibacillus oryzae]|uniref:DNA ligase (ATP) n=1 Tax=Gracilibacillus oryzae TaxID=1672701 RepID=A0A7C8KNA1_9BACI|nr:DNA ligase D [Gracilibacillus oryzae]KAB8127463.1 DNA ligase D [Gracilibacillus oryzae]